MTLVARQPRADAQRNRERLLSAAVAEFAEHGQDVPLETIAARAGVGIGTLYRHFPSRDALIVAAYQQEVDSLCSAKELVATMPADQASRNPHDVPVFQATGQRVRTGTMPSAIADAVAGSGC